MKCDSETCASHLYIVEAVKELKEMNGLLLKGQNQLKMTTVKLIESMKNVERLHTKIDKLEEHQEIKDREQDIKIDNLRIFTWKMVGAISVLVPLVLLLFKVMVS